MLAGCRTTPALVRVARRGKLDAQAWNHLAACDECAQAVAQTIRDHDDEPALAPRAVGRYIIEACLGQGRYGRVFNGYDPQLGRSVAIKILDKGYPPALLVEARAMAKLDHPNLVSIYDISFDDDDAFIAMQLADSGTLATRLGEIAHETATQYFRQAARGLSAMHRGGLLHRDIKPSNILLDTNGTRILLGDFGFASSVPGRDNADGDDSQYIAGSPAYMAPELLDGGSATQLSDQFALAATFFEVITGTRPFDGDTIASLQISHRQRQLPQRLARLPKALRRVLARGLSRDPQDRYASVDDMVRALGSPRSTPAKRWAVGLGATAVVGLITIIALSLRAPSPPQKNTTAALCDREPPRFALGPQLHAALTAFSDGDAIVGPLLTSFRRRTSAMSKTADTIFADVCTADRKAIDNLSTPQRRGALRCLQNTEDVLKRIADELTGAVAGSSSDAKRVRGLLSSGIGLSVSQCTARSVASRYYSQRGEGSLEEHARFHYYYELITTDAGTGNPARARSLLAQYKDGLPPPARAHSRGKILVLEAFVERGTDLRSAQKVAELCRTALGHPEQLDSYLTAAAWTLLHEAAVAIGQPSHDVAAIAIAAETALRHAQDPEDLLLLYYTSHAKTQAHETAVSLLRRALAVSKRIGTPNNILHAHIDLAFRTPDPAEASRLSKAAEAIAEESYGKFSSQYSYALSRWAIVEAKHKRVPQYIHHRDRAVAAIEQIGDTVDRFHHLCNLGRASLFLDLARDAERLLRRAQKLPVAASHKRGCALSLAKAVSRVGNVEEAKKLATSLFPGDRDAITIRSTKPLFFVATLEDKRGHWRRAVAAYKRIYHLSKTAHAPVIAARGAAGAAYLLVTHGDTQEARVWAERCADHADKLAAYWRGIFQVAQTVLAYRRNKNRDAAHKELRLAQAAATRCNDHQGCPALKRLVRKLEGQLK